MKRILVTGGAGFLGSHLIERLLGDGNEVTCIDNFFTGRSQNIVSFRSHPQFTMVRHDVTQPFSIDVDEIYHLACPASPVHYQRNPVRTLQTAVQGTLHMLELARDVGARILITSTSEVYGDPAEHPQTEEYWGHVNPVGERSCYDEGKRCGEALAKAFVIQFGIDVRIARIFNTYGPRMHEQDGRVVSNFITQALSGQAITLYGQGQQTRSFCYVSDMVEALVLTMQRKDNPGILNLGNPDERSVLELAELVLEMTQSCSAIKFEPLPADDPTRRCPSIEKAKRSLGWEPKVPLKDGLGATIADFRRRQQRAQSGQPMSRGANGPDRSQAW